MMAVAFAAGRDNASPAAEERSAAMSTDEARRTSVTDRRSISMLAQAAYYVATGMWPLVHLRSFEALTGPKPDRFVAESTGLLFVASGVALATAARRRHPGLAAQVLAVAVPAASTIATLRHRPRLRPVYLLDAAIQSALAVTTAAPVRRDSSRAR
jgi:hypothetical protein